MVTAGNGSLILQGASGRQYNLNFYSSDVLAAFVTWNLNGLAVSTSQNFYIVPEDCVIKDISFVSSNTVTTAFIPQVNDVNTGNVIAIAPILSTLNNRSVPNIGFKAGRKLTMLQA